MTEFVSAWARPGRAVVVPTQLVVCDVCTEAQANMEYGLHGYCGCRFCLAPTGHYAGRWVWRYEF